MDSAPVLFKNERDCLCVNILKILFIIGIFLECFNFSYQYTNIYKKDCVLRYIDYVY